MKLEWFVEQHSATVLRVLCEVEFPSGRQGGAAHFVSAQEWDHAGPVLRRELFEHAIRVLTHGVNRLEVQANENRT